MTARVKTPGCSSTKEALIRDDSNLHLTNDCPVCLLVDVRCPIGCHPSSAVLITKSLVRVLEKVVKVLEESQTDCYDKLSVSNKPRELTKRDFADTYNVDVDHLQCMVTGISSSSLHASDPSRNSRVVVAHLLPRCADSSTKLSLGYTWDDMESIRNTVILCKGIKDAFDSKLISFVPSEKPFSNNAYKMHVWSEDEKTRPIYKGATETIGSYEGLPLHLSVGEQEHNLFTRAVSYQAFCAFKVWGKQCGLKELLQTRGFSIYKGSYKARRDKYAKELAQAIEKDAEDGESDWNVPFRSHNVLAFEELEVALPKINRLNK